LKKASEMSIKIDGIMIGLIESLVDGEIGVAKKLATTTMLYRMMSFV